MKTRRPIMAFAATAWLVCATAVLGQDNGPEKKLSFYADARFRVELDRNSRSPDGTLRNDRDRLRYRLRFGFNYQYDRHFAFGGRLRSGSPGATQSPHITLGNELAPTAIMIDKAFISGTWNSQVGAGQAWVGKNSFPFWKQNEIFWDDDVTPEGLALRQNIRMGENGTVAATAAYFVLDASASNNFGDQARLVAGQLTATGTVGPTAMTGALGIYDFQQNDEQADVRLADLNYSILVASVKAIQTVRSLPVDVGLDAILNFYDYPSSLFNRNENTGLVASVAIGKLRNTRDWLLAYSYARVEKYSVVAGYAQDDWVRWGSSTVTAGSNMKGHEFRAAVALGARNNVVARLFVVDGIVRESPGAVALQDGTRFRIDWNIGF